MKSKPPDFDDVDAHERLAELLVPEIEAIRAQRAKERAAAMEAREKELQDGYDCYLSEHSVAHNKRFACKMALAGDVALLTRYLSWRHPYDPLVQVAVQLLQAAHPKKNDPWRPKMSEAARRKSNPMHDASDTVDILEEIILPRHYPDENAADIRHMACLVAELRHDVNYEDLLEYVQRPKNNKKRRIVNLDVF